MCMRVLSSTSGVECTMCGGINARFLRSGKAYFFLRIKGITERGRNSLGIKGGSCPSPHLSEEQSSAAALISRIELQAIGLYCLWGMAANGCMSDDFVTSGHGRSANCACIRTQRVDDGLSIIGGSLQTIAPIRGAVGCVICRSAGLVDASRRRGRKVFQRPCELEQHAARDRNIRRWAPLGSRLSVQVT